MSKITFRADEELVERVEALDASKSEVMREALRAYLDGRATESERRSGRDAPGSRPLDDLIAERLDALLAERLDAMLAERVDDRSGGQDIDLTVSLEGAGGTASPDRTGEAASRDPQRGPPSDAPRRDDPDARRASDAPERQSDDEHTCGQCGESLSADHVYCPNCGEKASRRVFCDCGDEVRTDWAFCPSCGRRTPAADVLEGN